MILAGDIGGTKTVLALFSQNELGSLNCELEQTFVSADFPQFNDILSVFLKSDYKIDSACFGLAGHVISQQCKITNLPWTFDAKELAIKFGTSRIRLLNDLEAMAIGMLQLSDTELIELNPAAQQKQQGNIAVIAAGTGLGEAILYWDGQIYHPIATEGGHNDLATQTEQQDQLLQYLRNRFNGHVSWERVLSGNGFGVIYDFLIDIGFAPPCSLVPDINDQNSSNDRNAMISGLGIADQDPVCSEVVRLFVELYGAEAGNLALKCMATGGVFVGGGIAPKILSTMNNGNFMRAFTSKGRFEKILSQISVQTSLNERTPLIGAANYFSNSINRT